MPETPEEFRQRVCARKYPIPTKAEARHLRRSTTSSLGGRFTVYACPIGDHWHVGHASSKKERRARRRDGA